MGKKRSAKRPTARKSTAGVRPPKRRVLRTPEELAALASPERMRLVEALAAAGPSTVRDLAARMGRAPQALYYHINALRSAGLVVQHAKRKTSRRAEAVFRLAASRLEIDPSNASSEYRRELAASAAAVLRAAERQVSAAIQSPDARLDGRQRNVATRRVTAKLNRASLNGLNVMLDNLVEFLAKHNDADSNAEQISLTLALHPLSVARRDV